MMLSTTETLLLTRLAALADKHGEPQLATDARAAVERTLAHSASVATRAAKRPAGSRGGAPTRAFAIELEPGPRIVVHGAKAAHAALEQALTDLGVRSRTPTAASLGVLVSRAGHWLTLVDTDNGTVSVTVKHAPDE